MERDRMEQGEGMSYREAGTTGKMIEHIMEEAEDA